MTTDVNRRWMPQPGLLALSVALSLSALVPLAYLSFPHLVRWQRVQQITSNDLTQREKALNAVIRFAGDDPALLQGVIAKLEVTDPANFLQIVMALDTAGCWRRAQVGDPPWLRWLDTLGRHHNPESRILAAQRLAALHDLACDARVLAQLGQLLNDSDDDVRYNALVSSGELAGFGSCVSTYRAMMLPRLIDRSALLRRHAWLILDALGDGSNTFTPWPPAKTFEQATPSRVLLASLEAAPVGSTLVAFEKSMAPLLRLLAVWKNRDAGVEELWPLFFSDQSTMRDLACVVALERGGRSQVAKLARKLLRDFDRHAQLSGAMLSGMTSANRDLLEQRLAIDSDWATSQMMRLGLWMQGQDDTFALAFPGLLLRTGDVPTSSLLLGMLHAGDASVRGQALDALFNPRGEPILDLVELFASQRWWHVLAGYLPADSPRFEVWADPSMMHFQVDQLRDTYLVQRTHWLTYSNATP